MRPAARLFGVTTRRILALLPVLMCVVSVAAAHDVQRLSYHSVGDRPASIVSNDDRTHEDTPFAVASVGKTMTSVAILRLVERGMLQLDALAASWLPADLPILTALNGITLRHLLTMTSGLTDYYTDDYIDRALDDPDHAQQPRAALHFVGDGLLFSPGTDFDYSNTNYLLLGLVLEQVTGKSYADVMIEEIFDPAGMESSFVFGSRRLPPDFVTGHEDGQHIRDYYAGAGFGDGGVIATARDLDRFYRALFEDDVLLSEPMLNALLSDPLGEGYGMGIEIDGDIVGHSGGDLGFSSDVRMDLETRDVWIEFAGEG